MINNNGWIKYNIWEHSTNVANLYERRCRNEDAEMTCAAQAADLLAPYVTPGDTFLDAGCGSGYFYHSIRKRNIPVRYYGIDASPSFIEIGRKYLPEYGLNPENLKVIRIEDLDGQIDHVLCMNVISNMDNYHRPLERFLSMARKTVILRESFKNEAQYSYVVDEYLDNGYPLKVNVNAYCLPEVICFIESYGFNIRIVQDIRSGGKPEMVIGYPHWWTFVICERQ